MNSFYISTDPALLDVEMIHHFLSTEAYWCKGIPLQTVQHAIDHSFNFGVYQNQQQVGYARVISDFATIAYLGDVFILPEFRGRGLSKLLMQHVMQHPQLQGLRRFILLTQDAHALYQQFGWQPIAAPDRWLEVHDKNVYCRNTPVACSK